MTKLFVKDLEIGIHITSQVFLLAQSSVAETKMGSPYLKVTLADRTGLVEPRYWDSRTEIADQLEVGCGIRVDGVVEERPEGCGERQVRVERLVPVEIVDFKGFLPRAKRDLEQMPAEIRRVREGLENPYLCRLLHRSLSDEEEIPF